MVAVPLASGAPAAVAQPHATAHQTASLAAVPAPPFSDGAPYPGPGPLALPASGGVIRAENFNSGAPEQAFHACTAGDQGTGRTYRSDPHDINIEQPSPGHFYVESSPPFSSPHSTHNCPQSTSFYSDYVKYSFTVAASGWYQIVGAGQNGKFWTRVDDVNLGQTGQVGTWANVLLAQSVHLTAGPTHVLTIELLGFRTDLDAVYINPTVVQLPLPRIVSAPLAPNEVVVADAVATDPMFGAVANNPAVDNRAAIQKALDTVGSEGGGIVFLPGGVYTVRGPLVVPASVTLHGDWNANTSRAGQTILAADVPSGVLGKPFISLGGTNAGLSHMSVWYPGQSFSHPSRYPPTIRSWNASVMVSDVTLFNSDQGIAYRGGSAADITGFRATCITTCILDDNNLEFAFITNVSISNKYWVTAPPEVTNKPVSAADRAALRKWTTRHLIGIHLYRNDNLTIYGASVAVTDALHGIVTTAKGCNPNCGTYGSFSKISATLDRRGDHRAARPAPNVNSIMDTDLVSHAKTISYTFAPTRLPARRAAADFYNVRLAPFSAQADGVTDDTAAIQSALNAAGLHGGGTVYMPAGTYLVGSHLLVPAGVELRGSYASRHTSESVDGTTLLAVEGQGTGTPDSDPAFISLNPFSGVRGFIVRYPNQGFGSAAYPVTPFPYTFRSLGADTWLRDVNVLNGYQIADLATYRSDGFVIEGLWASAFLSGVNLGGSSKTGWLERTVISYGDLYESRHRNSPHPYGLDSVKAFTSSHVVAYYVGAVSGLQSLGAMSYSVAKHFVTYKSAAGGPTNSIAFASSSDTARSTGFVLGAGSKIAFVGLLARSPYGRTHVSTASSFGGVASINDAAVDGNHGIVRLGGTLHVFPENLKMAKP